MGIRCLLPLGICLLRQFGDNKENTHGTAKTTDHFVTTMSSAPTRSRPNVREESKADMAKSQHDVRFGSFATNPFSTSADQCPLCPDSDRSRQHARAAASAADSHLYAEPGKRSIAGKDAFEMRKRALRWLVNGFQL